MAEIDEIVPALQLLLSDLSPDDQILDSLKLLIFGYHFPD
jgi:hypothetical protein